MSTIEEKINCELCGESVHTIQGHLKTCTGLKKTGWSLENAYDNYQLQFPDAPLMSNYAIAFLEEKKRRREAEENKTNNTDQSVDSTVEVKPESVEPESVEPEKAKSESVEPESVEPESTVAAKPKRSRKKLAKPIKEDVTVVIKEIDENGTVTNVVIDKEKIGNQITKSDSLENESRIMDASTKTVACYYTSVPTEYKVEKVAAYEVLGVDESLLLNMKKEPLKMTYFKTNPCSDYVPVKDPDYVFNDPDLIRDVLMMMEVPKMKGYLWGHAGTGKTSIVTQIAARLNRPLIRAQHTASTEEAHILGQMLAKSGSTYFEPGLLALAMKHGWIYLADEYDFAFPQILGLYQPVLEGEALVIKEATPEWRRIEPHRYFTLIGTGNTNGSGDETGLYQGTNIQNAANFSRFSIVSHVSYMKPEQEEEMLVGATKLPLPEVKKFVNFATRIRSEYEKKTISQPIGPRELIYAIKIGVLRGGDFNAGLHKAYINKLPSISAHAASEYCQRIFGGVK